MIDTQATATTTTTTSESDFAIKPSHTARGQPKRSTRLPKAASHSRQHSVSLATQKPDEAEEDEEDEEDQDLDLRTVPIDNVHLPHVTFSQAKAQMSTQGGRLKYYRDIAFSDESL